jgi:hypothetical protein
MMDEHLPTALGSNISTPARKSPGREAPADLRSSDLKDSARLTKRQIHGEAEPVMGWSISEEQLALLRERGVRFACCMGHEDAFSRPELSGSCRIGKETIDWTTWNGREAPKADRDR